jgi:hypothetical protein
VICGDQYLHVQGVDAVNGRVFFDFIRDIETTAMYLYLSAGVTGTVPIELRAAPIIESASIPTALAAVITGTGPIGLGLPASLYSDAPGVPQGAASPVWWDWSQGGIDEDLRAHGLALVMRGGVMQLRQVIPPIEAASTHDIVQSDLLIGNVPEIARGYEAPVASITFKDRDNDWTCAWTATTGPGRATLRTLNLTTQVRGLLTDPDAWMRLQATRLQWLAVGVPTLTIRLIGDILEVGQVVTLDSRYVSDGAYKCVTLPALVIARSPESAEYQLAVNLIPSAGAVWAFSIEVASAASAVITPSSQADLARFAAVVPVGTDVRITEHDSTSVLWQGTVASYQATTVTLSSAPTIAADEIAILTCETIPGSTYGALQARQVFAANAAGFIDTTEPAKVLS